MSTFLDVCICVHVGPYILMCVLMCIHNDFKYSQKGHVIHLEIHLYFISRFSSTKHYQGTHTDNTGFKTYNRGHHLSSVEPDLHDSSNCSGAFGYKLLHKGNNSFSDHNIILHQLLSVSCYHSIIFMVLSLVLSEITWLSFSKICNISSETR